MKTTYVKTKQITCVSEPSIFEQKQIKSSNDAQEFARQFYHADIELYESFFLMMLNRANVVTSYAKISQGGTAGTVVDPKIVSKYAIDDLCSSVIMVHNHPSGNTKPSNADEAITKKIKTGLAMFDIDLLEHIILTSASYFSFADNGLI
jgi:DNA repair protein RadC